MRFGQKKRKANNTNNINIWLGINTGLCPSIISILRMMKQEDSHEVKISLDYRVRHCLKKIK